MWQIQSMAHKNWAQKIKERTGATHVSYIKGEIKDGKKVNCIHIKSGDKELKYGGEKGFEQFDEPDYEAAIKEFNSL